MEHQNWDAIIATRLHELVVELKVANALRVAEAQPGLTAAEQEAHLDGLRRVARKGSAR